jgi:hypothetical protein
VDTQRTVQVGDRARTGPGAAARLVYFEGTSTELGPETGILIQRLERTAEGNLITRLFQAAGTTLNRVVRLADPAAHFEVETPAATALVRGTDLEVRQRATVADAPRQFLFQNRSSPPGFNPVEVCRGGGSAAGAGATTPPEHPAGSPGTEPPPTVAATAPCATILGGQEVLGTEGAALGAVVPLGTTDQQARTGASTDAVDAQDAAAQRQQRQQQQRALAVAQLLQAQAALVAAEGEAARLAQQEAALRQQIAELLGEGSLLAETLAGLPAGPTSPPCATGVGHICRVTLAVVGPSGVFGTAIGVVVASQSWTVTVHGLPAGAAATTVFQTTRGLETIACPASVAGLPTICRGPTAGTAVLNSVARVFVTGQLVAQGIVQGPGLPPDAVILPPTTGTSPTPSRTVTATPPGSRTPTFTAAATPTRTPTPELAVTTTPTAMVAAIPTASATVTATATTEATSTATATASSTPLPTGTTTPTVSPTTTATPSPSSTATVTATPTPPQTPVPGSGDCVPQGALCRVLLSPPAGPQAGGSIEHEACPSPSNCLQFTSTGAGFTLAGTITGAGGRRVRVDIPVVDAAGTPQDPRSVECDPAPSGHAVCSAAISDVFPQFGGRVNAQRQPEGLFRTSGRALVWRGYSEREHPLRRNRGGVSARPPGLE